MTDLLNALVVGCISRDQLQAIHESDGGDHRVCPPDGTTYPLKLSLNAPRQRRSRVIKDENLLR